MEKPSKKQSKNYNVNEYRKKLLASSFCDKPEYILLLELKEDISNLLSQNVSYYAIHKRLGLEISFNTFLTYAEKLGLKKTETVNETKPKQNNDEFDKACFNEMKILYNDAFSKDLKFPIRDLEEIEYLILNTEEKYSTTKPHMALQAEKAQILKTNN